MGLKAFEVYGDIALKGAEMAKKELEDFTKEGRLSSTAIAAAGAATAGAGMLITKALGDATGTAKEYGGEVIMIQRLTGKSAEESSKWAAILGRYGVEGSRAALVIKSLTNAIVTHSQALADVGVATTNTDGTNRSSLDVLADLAEQYKNAKDKTEILAAGTKALGRGFASLLPLLAGGKDAIAELAAEAEKNGLIFDDSDIASVKDYNKALKDNEQATKGLTVQWGLAAMPAETFKAKTLGGLLRQLREVNPEVSKLGGGIGSIAGPVLTGAGALVGFAAGLHQMGVLSKSARIGLVGVVGVLAAVQGSLVNSGIDKATADFSRFAESTGWSAKATGAWSTVVKAATAVAMPFAGVMRYNSAVLGWLGDRLGLTSGKQKDLADATDDGTDASKDAAEAADAQAGAQVNLARALDGTMVAVTDLTALERASSEADIAKAEATIASHRALKDMNTTLKEHHASKKLIAAADRAVKAGEPQALAFLEKHKKLTDSDKRAILEAAKAYQEVRDKAADARTAADAASKAKPMKPQSVRDYAAEVKKASDKVATLKAKLDTVPKDKQTKIKADIRQAEKDLKAAKKRLDDFRQTKIPQVKVDKAPAMQSIEAIKRALKAIPNEKVLVSVERSGTVTPQAYGGITRARPGGELQIHAERGVDEAAIPIEDTANSWALVGRTVAGMLGGAMPSRRAMPEVASRGNFVYSPTLQVDASAFQTVADFTAAGQALLSDSVREARALALAGGYL